MRILYLTLFILLPAIVLGNEHLTGYILDESKNGIANAEISIRGQNESVVSDYKGLYYFKLPKEYKLGEPITLVINKRGFQALVANITVNYYPNNFTLIATVKDKAVIVTAGTKGVVRPQIGSIKGISKTTKKETPKSHKKNVTTEESEEKASETIASGDMAYNQKDYEGAFADYFWVADSLDGFHELRIAEMFRYGRGVEADSLEAVKHYILAVDKGSVDAAYKLGTIYETGRGAKLDSGLSVQYYKIAANGGNRTAQYRLGRQAESKHNIAEALKWYKVSAENGNGYAQLRLGIFYKNGWGTTIDTQKAFYWIQKSAVQGNLEAQAALSEFVVENKDKPVSKVMAVKDSVFIFKDSFDSNINSWALTDPSGYSIREIKDGMFEYNNANAYGTPVFKNFDLDFNKDYLVSVAIRFIDYREPKVNGGVGLNYECSLSGVTRVKTFWIYNNGYCSFQDDDPSNQYYKISNFKKDFNILKIKKTGENLSFYVNDLLIKTVPNSRPRGPNFGFVASGFQKVQFDDFSISGIKSVK